MKFTIDIPIKTVMDLISLQEVEAGKVGNYTKVERQVDACRYHVADKIMTIVVQSLKNNKR